MTHKYPPSWVYSAYTSICFLRDLSDVNRVNSVVNRNLFHRLHGQRMVAWELVDTWCMKTDIVPTDIGTMQY